MARKIEATEAVAVLAAKEMGWTPEWSKEKLGAWELSRREKF